MITLKTKNFSYTASTVKEIMDNVAQDNGYKSFAHYSNVKKAGK